jgi:hypothetical protein
LLIGPLAAAMVASGLHRWPFAPRLLIFAVPLLVLLLGAGVQAVGRLTSRIHRQVGFAVVPLVFGVLLAAPVGYALHDAIKPPKWESAGPAISRFEQSAGPHDVLYVSNYGLPAWLFYTTDWAGPGGAAEEVLRTVEESQLNSSAPEHEMLGNNRDLESRVAVTAEAGYRVLIGHSAGAAGWRGIPTPGWADTEAAWLKAEARPEVSLLYVGPTGEAWDQLKDALDGAGGYVVSEYKAADAYLYLYRFS